MAGKGRVDINTSSAMGQSICVITQQLGHIFSGPGVYAKNLIWSLIQNGYDVHVIAPYTQRPTGDLPYKFIGVSEPFKMKSQARWIQLSLQFSIIFNKICKRTRFDLVHFTDAREALFFQKKRYPLIGNVNDTYAAELKPLAYYRQYYYDWFQRWIYYKFVQATEGSVYRKFDRIIANSYFTAEVVQKQYQIHSQQISMCYKSIDYHFWEDRSGPHSLNNQNILFTGTNFQRKGLPVLIRAAPEILKEFPDVIFTVVGEDPSMDKMKILAANYGVLHNFNFLGWQSQDNIRNLLTKSDILVLPSLTESLGIVILEAMAAGVPVIASNIGGIPEIVQNGVNGILIAPDDPANLSEAITNVLTDKNLSQLLIENGKSTAHKFNLENMMLCTYKIYKDVLLEYGKGWL